MIDLTDIEHIRKIIAAKTGIFIRSDDASILKKNIQRRLKELGIKDIDAYRRLITGSSGESEREWKSIVSLITTGETYFFRDKGQFSLLEMKILPELIRRKSAERSLRIWSAGCSTGEEVYSLAILVDRLLGEDPGWKILVIGTDINEEAIEKAQKAIYGNWSFRLVSPRTREKYFRQNKTGWSPIEKIRKMASFMPMNLAEPPSPHTSEFKDMDLILCRNVFIYFAQETTKKIAGNLTASLREGGYLLTGHAELTFSGLKDLSPRIFADSVIYQKASGRIAPPPPLPLPIPAPLRIPASISASPPPPQAPPKGSADSRPHPDPDIKGMLERGDYESAIAEALRTVAESGPSFDAHLYMAMAYANLGKHAEAEENVRRALEINSFSADAYHLLALIERERGNSEAEREMLKKVIYLDPSRFSAYLELAAIYNGDMPEKARKMRESAMEILKKLPADANLKEYPGFSVEEIIRHVSKIIKGW